MYLRYPPSNCYKQNSKLVSHWRSLTEHLVMANSSLARSTLLHIHKLCGSSRTRALSQFNLTKRPLGVISRSNQNSLLQDSSNSRRFSTSLSSVRFYSSSSSSGNDDADDPIKNSGEIPGSPFSGNTLIFDYHIFIHNWNLTKTEQKVVCQKFQ